MSQASDGFCEVYTRRTPVARKPHACCACGETIRPGDRYLDLTTIHRGDLRAYKRCLRCDAIHVHLVANVDAAGDRGEWWPAEALDCGNRYEDEWGGPPPDDISRLAFLTPDEAQSLFAPAAGRGRGQ